MHLHLIEKENAQKPPKRNLMMMRFGKIPLVLHLAVSQSVLLDFCQTFLVSQQSPQNMLSVQ